MKIILVMLAGYLLGSIPFGVIAARFYRIDITKYGSGNIGATNVLRILGLFPTLVVLILDLLKGTFAAFLGIILLKDPSFIVLSGLSAILGHMFSVFLRFKGGKGAAVGLGVLLAVAPDIFTYTSILAILIIYIFRYVSLASIILPPLVAGLMFYSNRPTPYIICSLLVAALMIMKHVPNIKRLMAGTEGKIGEIKNV